MAQETHSLVFKGLENLFPQSVSPEQWGSTHILFCLAVFCLIGLEGTGLSLGNDDVTFFHQPIGQHLDQNVMTVLGYS